MRVDGWPRAVAAHATMAGMKATITWNVLILGAALLLSGCSKEGPPPASGGSTGGDTTAEPAGEPGGEPATGTSTAGEGPTCQSDADCVVSCSRTNECCDQLCPPCEQVFHKDALAALEQWKGPNCAAVSCPVAKCMAPKEETIARCTSGQCTIERRPVPTP
jgi:hypothetical protein